MACGGCPAQDSRVAESMTRLNAALNRLENSRTPGSGPPPSFADRGQTVNGSSHYIRDVQNVPNMLVGGFKGLDPQIKILLWILGGYMFFWYLA
ncbi:hypothetical protein PM082_003261 [Marasmius tenuissimus]|nr:hypothetical protein PM082_003261 [Marasmius tenuissimus]